MYHEETYEQVKRRRLRRIAAAIAVVLVLVASLAIVRVAQSSMREQGAVSVRESVLSAAKQCCAVEGSYPSSITHLEERYGLTINRNDYVVSYEWFADNVMPTVVVTPR